MRRRRRRRRRRRQRGEKERERDGEENERESERIVPAGRQGRNDVADYRPGLCSGLTPAPVTGNPSYRPAGRLAGDAALYATSVWRRWDQQCLSRFRSRSVLRLVNAVRTCSGCHLGANTRAHAHTHRVCTHEHVTRAHIQCYTLGPSPS